MKQDYDFQALCAIILCLWFNAISELMKVMNEVPTNCRVLKPVTLLPCINNRSGRPLHR
jgi:hypothetical protein